MATDDDDATRAKEVEFPEVLREELECVKRRRQLVADPSEADPEERDHRLNINQATPSGAEPQFQHVLNADLTGLSISGGGIRSATFGLGVLQGLAAAGLLPRFDYLSTVSGGGYIGSWLGAWIARAGLDRVIKDLKVPRGASGAQSSEDPGADVPPIKHLRRYSNYLAPRVGLLSLDSWVLIAIYVRNLLLNQLVILCMLLAFYLAARSLVELFTLWHTSPREALFSPYLAGGSALFTAASLFVFALLSPSSKLTRDYSLAAWSTLLLTVSVVAASVYLASDGVDQKLFLDPDSRLEPKPEILGYLCLCLGGIHLLLSIAMLIGREVSRCLRSDAKALWQTPRGRNWRLLVWELFWTPVAGLLAGAAGGTVLFYALNFLYRQEHTVVTFAVFGPAVLLLCFVLTNFLHVGLLGANLRRHDRERWSSLNARALVVVLNWLAIMGVTVFAPAIVVWLWDLPWGGALAGALSGGWLASTATGLWTGTSTDSGRSTLGTLKRVLATVTPYIFLLGLAIGLSFAANYAVYEVNAAVWRERAPLADESVSVQDGDLRRFCFQRNRYLGNFDELQWGLPIGETTVLPLFCFVIAAGAAFAIALGLAKCIGVNAFTLHDLYAHRLVRCYLGASKRRDPDPLTNFDPGDDLRLSELTPARWVGGMPVSNQSITVAAPVKAGTNTISLSTEGLVAGDVLQIGPPGPGQEFCVIAEAPLVDADNAEAGRHPRALHAATIQYRLDTVLRWDHAHGEAVLPIEATRLLQANEARTRLSVVSVGSLREGTVIAVGLPGEAEVRRLTHVDKAVDDSAVLGFDLPLRRPPAAGSLVLKLVRNDGSDVFVGPYHLVNGALNRKGGRQKGNELEREAEALAFQDRKAESFVFAPLYCGSEATGYCPTDAFAGNIRLGTAMAVSGAAVSPNMGYQSSPAMTLLLTLFNLRLGAWFGNPREPKTRESRNPPFNPLAYIYKEMTGQVTADADYVYVSDGGHFENMGVYELIRRRCRFIVAIDTWADPEMSRENLGRLIRNVRVDFGIRIEIDIERTRPDANGFCQQHFALGRIHYGDVHRKDNFMPPQLNDPNYNYEANQGVLLYLKVGLTGDEPNDLLNYRAENPLFPHHPINDQFFDEAQFESYRELGVHTVEQLLEGETVETRDPGSGEMMVRELKLYGKHHTVKEKIEQRPTHVIFDRLFRRWLPPPPQHHSEVYERHNTIYADLMKQLRSSPELQNLAAEFYGNEHNPNTIPTLAERLMVVQMMTLLENVWLGLELEKYRHHPVNAGWINVFHAWATKNTARTVWKGIKDEFTPSFQEFIAIIASEPVKQVRIPPAPEHLPVTPTAAAPGPAGDTGNG